MMGLGQKEKDMSDIFQSLESMTDQEVTKKEVSEHYH